MPGPAGLVAPLLLALRQLLKRAAASCWVSALGPLLLGPGPALPRPRHLARATQRHQPQPGQPLDVGLGPEPRAGCKELHFISGLPHWGLTPVGLQMVTGTAVFIHHFPPIGYAPRNWGGPAQSPGLVGAAVPFLSPHCLRLPAVITGGNQACGESFLTTPCSESAVLRSISSRGVAVRPASSESK